MSKVEGAFGVSIQSFHDGNRSFYANTANPTVPSNLSISWVGGLNNAAVIEAAHSSVHPASGYSPNDLRKAYNVSGAERASRSGSPSGAPRSAERLQRLRERHGHDGDQGRPARRRRPRLGAG